MPPAAFLVELDGQFYVFKYVDDTTSIEIVKGERSTKHFTTRQTVEEVPAPLTQLFMNNLVSKANDIGMRVNCKKTQLLCVTPDNGCLAECKITVGNESISAGSSLKLLGFMLNSKGDMSDQCRMIKDKFRAKFWSLIHLKRAGLRGKDLYDMYVCFVRPILETNCVIFHPMLTRQQSNEIELMQKRAVKLCYGFHRHYGEILATENIRTLEQRRDLALSRFALKTMNDERFGPMWYKRRNELNTDLRQRRPYVENRATTNRYRNSPLLSLQRRANDLSTTTTT